MVGYSGGGDPWSRPWTAPQVKIHGEYIPVNAQIVDIEGFSVHADGDELLTWPSVLLLRHPRSCNVVHGEPAAAATLARRIGQSWAGWRSSRETASGCIR